MPYEQRPVPVCGCGNREPHVHLVVPIVLASAVLFVLLVVGSFLAASRSSSDGSPRQATTGVPRTTGGEIPAIIGTPPSPAPANVAGSEGTSVPTTPMPASHLASRQGEISHMGPEYPRSYLALPCKHGNMRCHLTVRLCGPADCVTMRQTDYGPSQRIYPDRIADVSVAVFERICGVPARFGLCPGSWTAVESRPRVTLPPTDSEENP